MELHKENKVRLRLEQLEDRFAPSGTVVTGPPAVTPPVVTPPACAVTAAAPGLAIAATASSVVHC